MALGVLALVAMDVWWVATYRHGYPFTIDDLSNRILNLGLMTAAGIAVAATWYAHNLGTVFDYLTGYGYGAQSAYYGSNHSIFSWSRWHAVASRIHGSMGPRTPSAQFENR